MALKYHSHIRLPPSHPSQLTAHKNMCISSKERERIDYSIPRLSLSLSLAVLVINFTRILAGPGGRGVVLYESDISKPCLYLV